MAQPHDFAPGSFALWQGHRCRIHQWNSDGTALIFVGDRARRAAPEELAPPPEPEPVERWAEARLGARGGSHFVSMVDLWTDFTRWCDEQDIGDFRVQTQLAFGRALAALGFRAARRIVRQPFSQIERSEYGLAVELLPRPVIIPIREGKRTTAARATPTIKVKRQPKRGAAGKAAAI